MIQPAPQPGPQPDAPRRGDEGVTLVELLVTLAIMGTLMAIFTTGILQVYRAANVTDSLATAQAQLHTAFDRLDKHVRYAKWIRQPVDTGAYRYVEFLAADPATGQPQCHRLIVDTAAGLLRLHTWTPGGLPTAGNIVASHLVTSGSVTFVVEEPGSQPYATAPAGASFTPDYQRLQVRLTARVGTGEHARTTSSDAAFTAVNTSRVAVAGTQCTEGRP